MMKILYKIAWDMINNAIAYHANSDMSLIIINVFVMYHKMSIVQNTIQLPAYVKLVFRNLESIKESANVTTIG